MKCGKIKDKNMGGIMMTTVYLVRHGTTKSNIDGKFQGTLDIPLNEQGLLQANYLGERFKNIKIDMAYTSPLLRAVQTTDGLCKYKNIEKIICENLMELDVGELAGHTGAENEAKYPQAMEMMRIAPAKFQAPGGESTLQVYNRMKEALKSIVKQNQGKKIAVVSHGFAIQTYIGYAKGIPFHKLERYIVNNASVSKITYDEDLSIKIEYLNDDTHLPKNLSFKIAQKFINA